MGDRAMRLHPVWIILGLSYFGYIWGPLGALMSVPMIAMVKTFAVEARGDESMPMDRVVPAIAEAVLACFEGRKPCWQEDLEKTIDFDDSPAAHRRPPPPRGHSETSSHPTSPQQASMHGTEGSQQSPQSHPQHSPRPPSSGLMGAV